MRTQEHTQRRDQSPEKYPSDSPFPRLAPADRALGRFDRNHVLTRRAFAQLHTVVTELSFFLTRRPVRCLTIALLCLCLFPPARADDKAVYTRTQDVVYGRLYATALTMDVIAPKENANHAGIIWVISGGWLSSHDYINPNTIEGFAGEYLRRGYTVFAVVHGCQPKFSIPEITPQINRAVRYIRFHAKDYDIDPNRLGVTGGSAGGHLSMMQACAPEPENPKSPDPVDRVSSRVQAVGCFFPPTDFLNYGKPNGRMSDFPGIAMIRIDGAFDYHHLNPKTNTLDRILDPVEIAKIERDISPFYHVSKDSAPALIIHGDADKIVPLQQAQVIIDAYNKLGVPAKLIVKLGAGHGWLQMGADIKAIADWFDEHLQSKIENQNSKIKSVDPAPKTPEPRN